MTPAVFELLMASPDVVNTVGDRVFSGGIAPPETITPYICWAVIAGQPQNVLQGRPDMDEVRVQVDCWADSHEDAVTLYDAVVDALELAAHQESFNFEGQDFETKKWRRSADFTFWDSRPAI